MGRNYLGKRPVQKGMDKNYITTNPSTTVALSPSAGVYLLQSTSALKNWNVRAPLASEVGQIVEFHAIKCTTSLLVKLTLVNASLYSTVGSTSIAKDTIRMNRADQSIALRAISTAKYKIAYANQSPTITTS